MRASPPTLSLGDRDGSTGHPPVFHHCDVNFVPDAADLLGRLGLQCYPEEADDFLALLDEACGLARPRAAYLRAIVSHADRDSGRVAIGGIVFTGCALAERVALGDTVWPHLATCGRELDAFVLGLDNPLERFWGESILMEALLAACRAMEAAITAECGSSRLAYLGPGSLPAWAVEEQEPLFRLLHQAVHSCGVELTAGMTMQPMKSLSGIYFSMPGGRSPCGECEAKRCGAGDGLCACRGREPLP